MRRLTPRLATRWLVLSDAGAMLVFTCIGLLSHERAITAAGLARDTLPLLVGWLVAALVLRTYGRSSPGRVIATWAIGIPAGVLLRGLVLGRDLDGGQAAFLVTTLCFSALLIGGARLALSGLRGADGADGEASVSAGS